MRLRKHYILHSAIALLMVGIYVFSQWIVADHQKLHATETKQKDIHHSDNCFICHTQDTVFIPNEFHFKIKEYSRILYPLYFTIIFISLPKQISNLHSGRAPPYAQLYHKKLKTKLL